MQYNGEGIQHIALFSDDLIATIDQLSMNGVPLMTAPNDIYYEMLEQRLPGHGEPVDELQTRGILLDGSTEGGNKRLLLQIFCKPQLGPVFFEFIQRKGDDGFGEGNFKALFESIERDQVRRGVLQTGVTAEVAECASRQRTLFSPQRRRGRRGRREMRQPFLCVLGVLCASAVRGFILGRTDDESIG